MNLGGIIRAVVSVLPVLGKLGKGKATVVGAVGTAVSGALHVGAPFIGGVVNSENIVPLVRVAADVLIALFALIGSFGVGRKAGYAVVENGAEGPSRLVSGV